ncbi:acylphosphatase [Sulfuritalea sp.]|uniref:acylphosphatase n=1 Tax=Sulfuritalea sp. TaxID=2480090 RepID=UPI001ACAEC07|nr:acylphosphatase [Sulfuritalea sp.]MBN8475107.1 acylphosphatase [Sulfuritalea sp.]
MTEVRRLVIRGVVQGVGFRYAMAAQARLLGVTGWVRNRRDGSVEAMVAGDGAQIGEMLAWSRIGPAGAAVDEVMVEGASGCFAGFDSLPTA